MAKDSNKDSFNRPKMGQMGHVKHNVKHIIGRIKGGLSGITILDPKLIRDLVQFYNAKFQYTGWRLGYREAMCLLTVAKRINADLWNISAPKTALEVQNFYRQAPYYPFDLANWHMEYGVRRFRKLVLRECSGKVLDYGGGIGTYCMQMAKKGLKVDYADVRGLNWEFAEWLFEKRGYKIGMLDLTAGVIPNNDMYDTIVCISVMEHVADPASVLRDMVRHLNRRGRLIVTNLDRRCEFNFMRFPMEYDATKLLNSLGVFKAEKDWLWMKS